MIRTIDLFCGAGGCSWGARAAGATIVAGFDLWDIAVSTFRDNFPEASGYRGDLLWRTGKYAASEHGPIDLIIASPECTSHTHARGGLRPSEDSRMTAFLLLKFAKALKPRWVVIENVVNMKTWARYQELLERLRCLGYRLREQTLDASDFGVPQSRRRLFITGDLRRDPPEVLPSRSTDPVPARNILHPDGLYPFSPLWRRRRARATLARARRAIRVVGSRSPFLIVYYGRDRAGGWQRVTVPLRTVTTLDRFALVRKREGKRVMRMLQPEELRAAMGFPESFRLQHGTRRDQIHLLGNAVCPPVIEAIVSRITSP